uniref:Uncharacterized protein n=1 Tax=Candidatus Kentrum sp. FW TaxID=2126338 RepID=A0A450TGR6_9GAMM|nr:MAG: hypothetical protein BECKFW1821C_GA0114237_100946 [Candidatus Kentron sp. FW]
MGMHRREFPMKFPACFFCRQNLQEIIESNALPHNSIDTLVRIYVQNSVLTIKR